MANPIPPEQMSLKELKIKRGLLEIIIRQAKADGDPRVNEPIRQQKNIDKMIIAKLKAERKARGEPEPPPITVGVKPASIMGKARRGKEV